MTVATEIATTDVSEMEAVRAQLVALTESHNRILALLEKLESQIGPTIEAMSNGPIGKLMGL